MRDKLQEQIGRVREERARRASRYAWGPGDIVYGQTPSDPMGRSDIRPAMLDSEDIDGIVRRWHQQGVMEGHRSGFEQGMQAGREEAESRLWREHDTTLQAVVSLAQDGVPVDLHANIARLATEAVRQRARLAKAGSYERAQRHRELRETLDTLNTLAHELATHGIKAVDGWEQLGDAASRGEIRP